MPENAAEKFDHWAILEIMGHQRLAGRVSESTLAGVAMIRVDVPGSPTNPEFTTYLGAQSIFRLTPVSEQVARAKAAEWAERPVTIYRTDLQRRLGYRDCDDGGDDPDDPRWGGDDRYEDG